LNSPKHVLLILYLHQVCGVATRQGAALQLVLTDLHTLLHPATALPPMQVDEGKQGKDGDHQTLILAPKSGQAFVVKREKKVVKTRPITDSSKQAFCHEVTNHKWDDIKENENLDEKVDSFHKYLRDTLDKHMPEKTVVMTNLDKFWMTPDLKQLLRQMQRERLKHGNSKYFCSMRAKFRKLKRKKIKTNTKNVVNELKVSAPGKWHSVIKKMGGVDQMSAGRLEVESLKGFSDQECAEAVAEAFAATSLEFEPIDTTKLPAFLPAGKVTHVNCVRRHTAGSAC